MRYAKGSFRFMAGTPESECKGSAKSTKPQLVVNNFLMHFFPYTYSIEILHGRSIWLNLLTKYHKYQKYHGFSANLEKY